eukprot:GHVL01005845.1.p1 GENE.GHVL01005845.1~~GHVL01005845.1.p1  ORF type:complete len:642 (-),score=191.96 GHVL01005845.1:4211-6136(-)
MGESGRDATGGSLAILRTLYKTHRFLKTKKNFRLLPRGREIFYKIMKYVGISQFLSIYRYSKFEKFKFSNLSLAHMCTVSSDVISRFSKIDEKIDINEYTVSSDVVKVDEVLENIEFSLYNDWPKENFNKSALEDDWLTSVATGSPGKVCQIALAITANSDKNQFVKEIIPRLYELPFDSDHAILILFCMDFLNIQDKKLLELITERIESAYENSESRNILTHPFLRVYLKAKSYKDVILRMPIRVKTKLIIRDYIYNNNGYLNKKINKNKEDNLENNEENNDFLKNKRTFQTMEPVNMEEWEEERDKKGRVIKTKQFKSIKKERKIGVLLNSYLTVLLYHQIDNCNIYDLIHISSIFYNNKRVLTGDLNNDFIDKLCQNINKYDIFPYILTLTTYLKDIPITNNSIKLFKNIYNYIYDEKFDISNQIFDKGIIFNERWIELLHKQEPLGVCYFYCILLTNLFTVNATTPEDSLIIYIINKLNNIYTQGIPIYILSNLLDSIYNNGFISQILLDNIINDIEITLDDVNANIYTNIQDVNTNIQDVNTNIDNITYEISKKILYSLGSTPSEICIIIHCLKTLSHNYPSVIDTCINIIYPILIHLQPKYTAMLINSKKLQDSDLYFYKYIPKLDIDPIGKCCP